MLSIAKSRQNGKETKLLIPSTLDGTGEGRSRGACLGNHRIRPLYGKTALVFALLLFMTIPQRVSAGPIRIWLSDGNKIDVPYCWEVKGHVFFNVPGGTVAIPQSEIRAIEEVVAQDELEMGSETRTERLHSTLNVRQRALLQKVLEEETPSPPNTERIQEMELASLLQKYHLPHAQPGVSSEEVFSRSVTRTGDFREWMRLRGNGLVLVVKNVIATRNDVMEQRYDLVLYDDNGRVLQRQPCRLAPIDIPEKTLKTLGISGRLYSILATIKPDPRIRRYEITTLKSLR